MVGYQLEGTLGGRVRWLAIQKKRLISQDLKTNQPL